MRGDHDWTLVCCVVYGQTEQNMPAVTMSHYISLIPSSVQAEQLLITKTDRQTEHWETVGHYVNWHLKISLQNNTTCIETRISTHPL